MKKRNEYPSSLWGFLAFVFQSAFVKFLAVLALILFTAFMWSNFSCDKAQGPRIEKTDVKVKIGEKQ